tara:strand:+ start:220 stop:1257 length:1038 start_codon:yes stop_codon:yes gene_type:complete
MQIGYISFCDKTAFNIKTQSVKEQILKDIYDITEIKIIQKHFEILKEHHFKKLNDNPHLVSLKSNGNPYLLYLTKYNFVNTCIFIDKKVQAGYFLPRMIMSRFNFPDELFENTLLEGEMIKDNNKKWIFLINDIYIHQNQSLQNKNILKRIEFLNNIFLDFKNDPDDVCLFQINKYFKYDQFNHLINDYKKSLNYTCRGIYFKPIFYKFKNILHNFDDSLVCKVQKIKYQKGNEFISDNKCNPIIDNNKKINNPIQTLEISTKISDIIKKFYIENTDLPDVYNLYNCDNDTKSYTTLYDIAYIPNIKCSNFIRELFYNKSINSKIKVECIFINKFNKWKPVKIIS